jgi:bifunctional non-homologous end joining protein LigD
MAKTRLIGLDTSLQTYRSKRDFSITPKPPAVVTSRQRAEMFVVQKHAAHRAGLHWDFRLEHGGVLWNWAVPKGPSLDPADKRMAIHVEDHPIDYAEFEGTIPTGEYGGGAVETWDRGTWEPLVDPDDGMRKGELKFLLAGQRLKGRFTLVRLHQRGPQKPEAWFLIKGHDEEARTGVSAPALEQIPIDRPTKAPSKAAPSSKRPPASGAVRGRVPDDQRPQLCQLVEEAPMGAAWVSEIKFDGYRLLARLSTGEVRLITRNGHDWSDRLPAVAKAMAQVRVRSAVLDGELVALRADGVSSFPDLQAALSAGQDHKLFFYVFDLLEFDGWDLRACALIDRKAVLEALTDWTGMLRFSAHTDGDLATMHRNACEMRLEGIVCKKTDRPYRAGRGHGWLKLKCLGREEFVVLGWTPPGGSRTGIGALHLGYFDPEGGLHYTGAAGTGFTARELDSLRTRLDALKARPPQNLLMAGDPIDSAVQWVRPELVVEAEYTSWSGAGRLRHPVYLGIREDKAPPEVVREIAGAEAERSVFIPRGSGIIHRSRGWKGAIPPVHRPVVTTPAEPQKTAPTRIIVAKAPRKPGTVIGDVELTHPDKEIWPGITKRQLAEYWQAVAEHALPGLAHRPLSILRCPDGIAGEHFFQKNGHGHLPLQIREGSVSGSPYLAIDDVNGLIALTQMSAIELHPWGASEADPMHPDWLVFDLDPGEGVAFDSVIEAANDVRDRLTKLRLTSFCRTTGGKGLHIVMPLGPSADWEAAKRFCRAFADVMSQEEPKRFLAHLKIADRKGRILIDWLRNGMGATAVSSYCPRARAGATVATPLAWDEVKSGLDPTAFTVLTIPKRLKRLKKSPWKGFAELRQLLPQAEAPRPRSSPVADQSPTPAAADGAKKSSIIFAPRPTRRA